MEKIKLKQIYDEAEVVKRYWKERFASPYGKILHQSQVQFIQNLINRNQPRKILDIASGPARIPSQLNGDFVGVMVDSSTHMLAEAETVLRSFKKDENWIRVCADAFSLPFSEKFELVTCFRFIRHFKYGERKKIYQEIRRVLRPQGWLVFDAVNFDGAYELRKQDKALDSQIYDKLYRWEELEEEMSESGFKIKESQGILFDMLLYRRIDGILRAGRQTWLETPLLRWLNRRQKKEPLEWILACQK